MWWCKVTCPGSLRIAVLAGLLCGCGFHLRGDVAYPAGMTITYIEAADHYTPFYQKLKAALKDGRVQVTQNPASAGAIVRPARRDRPAGPVRLRAQHAHRYDVFYIVRYSLESRARKRGAQQLALTALTYDETWCWQG